MKDFDIFDGVKINDKEKEEIEALSNKMFNEENDKIKKVLKNKPKYINIKGNRSRWKKRYLEDIEKLFRENKQNEKV